MCPLHVPHRVRAGVLQANASALATGLTSKGYKLATDGTENHLILWDLRPAGVTGSKMEKICDAVGITLNKNCVPGDRSAMAPVCTRALVGCARVLCLPSCHPVAVRIIVAGSQSRHR